jgi:LuxR family maltose regulon positive regulatory protein
MHQYARQALESLPEQELSWRIIASIALADAHLYQGEYTSAYRARLGALEASNETSNIYLIITSSLRLAVVLREQGALQRVIDICQQQLQLAEESGLSQSGSVGWLLAIWGEVLAETNHLDEALEKTRKGLELAERGGDVAILGLTNLCLVRVLFSRGDFAGAAKIMQKMQNRARQYAMPPWMTSEMAAWQAWIWLAQDKLSAACQWVEERGLEADREPTYLNAFEYRVLARIRIAQGQVEHATMLLQRLLEAAEAGQHTSRVIEILMLQALAFQAGGEPTQAVTRLERALTLAEPEGFVRIFVDEGPPMVRLLHEAVSRGIAPDYARRLLAAFPASEADQLDRWETQAPGHDLVEPLSERELEVLELVARGLTNREIASRLFLSLNTVKAHTRNIYGKLGVRSRTQAVAKARSLGVLSSI